MPGRRPRRRGHQPSTPTRVSNTLAFLLASYCCRFPPSPAVHAEEAEAEEAEGEEPEDEEREQVLEVRCNRTAHTFRVRGEGGWGIAVPAKA